MTALRCAFQGDDLTHRCPATVIASEDYGRNPAGKVIDPAKWAGPAAGLNNEALRRLAVRQSHRRHKIFNSLPG